MGAATVASRSSSSSSSSSSLLYPLLSLLLISSTTSARLLITLATVSAAASATAAAAAATVDDDSSAVDHYEAAPCHHRGTRYPHPHHPHHHHHHLPHIHHRRISTHRLLAAPPLPHLHHHHLTRVHHLGRGDEWLPLPPPPQGPGFWAEESPPPIIDTGGSGGEPGYNVVPVVRLVETYGGQRGDGGDGGALGGLGGGEGGGERGGGEGVSMEENIGNQEQFRGGRGGGGGGGNSQSPQVESVKDPILISTKLPTESADSSAESGSSSNTDNRANQAREYGGHNSGVTYTRFHLPDPNELITGDPPSSSVSGAAPHLPGVIYRLESPTLIGGHHHHHPLPGPPMNELPKTTSGKKKSKKRKNKSKNKAVTKLTLNPYVATTADPNQFGNNNNSPYSVNKIIVIEEDGAGIGPPPGLVESSQIERPQLTSEIQHQNNQNLKDTFQPVHRVHFPPPQNRPQNVQTIKTIKDLHDQLNVSLFQNQNQQQETQTTTMSPIIAELIEKLNSGNSAGVPPTTTTTPLFKNNSTLENSALASKHFTGSSGYFVKANRFQFQNSWTSTEAPPTSSSTSAVTPPVVYFTSQRNFAPTPAKTTPQPPSPSPSTSTTIITSTPTPTTLAVPATVRVITSPTSTTGVHSLHPPHHPPNHHLHHHQSRPEIMSARKHGSQSGNGNQESSAHQLSAATTVDMSQVASIIIGFCVAMMALAGVILMVLHRDTVTGQLRTFRENLESRYPNLALNRNGNGGNPPNPPNSSQPSSSSSSSSHDFNSHHPQNSSSIVHSHQGEPRRVSVPIPPPPPPPPLPLPQSNPPNQEHLIEQIIGRPAETGHFTNKKCRQYFSRVHRWVPKRPPLPESCDLKSTAVTRINL